MRRAGRHQHLKLVRAEVQFVEAVAAVEARHRRGDDRAIHVQELHRDPRQPSFTAIELSIAVPIGEDSARDRGLEEEHVRLQIRHARIGANHIGQRRVLDGVELGAGEGALIPEAIAIAQARELIGDDTGERRSDAAAGDVVLRETANPQVDVVDVAVELLQCLLELRVGGDVGKARDARQPVGGARGVVI